MAQCLTHKNMVVTALSAVVGLAHSCTEASEERVSELLQGPSNLLHAPE